MCGSCGYCKIVDHFPNWTCMMNWVMQRAEYLFMHFSYVICKMSFYDIRNVDSRKIIFPCSFCSFCSLCKLYQNVSKIECMYENVLATTDRNTVLYYLQSYYYCNHMYLDGCRRQEKPSKFCLHLGRYLWENFPIRFIF